MLLQYLCSLDVQVVLAALFNLVSRLLQNLPCQYQDPTAPMNNCSQFCNEIRNDIGPETLMCRIMYRVIFFTGPPPKANVGKVVVSRTAQIHLI